MIHRDHRIITSIRLQWLFKATMFRALGPVDQFSQVIRCKQWLLTSLVSFLLLLIPADNLWAQEVHLKDIIVTNTRNELRMFLDMEGAISGDIRKAILEGIPTTFTFFVTLHEVRSLWLDKEIADFTITHSIVYDKASKTFTVRRSWQNDVPIRVMSLKDAEKLMNRVEGLRITSLSNLVKGRHYQIRVKAQLDRITLPLKLHYVLFFLSLWNVETDWYAIDFVY